MDCRIRNLKEKDMQEVAEFHSLFWKDKMNLPKMKKEVFTNFA